jgi:hypothetical protein
MLRPVLWFILWFVWGLATTPPEYAHWETAVAWWLCFPVLIVWTIRCGECYVARREQLGFLGVERHRRQDGSWDGVGPGGV